MTRNIESNSVTLKERPQIGKRLLGKVSSEIRKDVRKTHLRNKTYKKDKW